MPSPEDDEAVCVCAGGAICRAAKDERVERDSITARAFVLMDSSLERRGYSYPNDDESPTVEMATEKGTPVAT